MTVKLQGESRIPPRNKKTRGQSVPWSKWSPHSKLCGVPLLELVNCFLRSVFCVGHRLAELCALLVHFFRGSPLARLPDILSRILHVSPSFFARALHLIGDTFIGQLVAPHRFAGSLLDLSHDLPDFSEDLILIH